MCSVLLSNDYTDSMSRLSAPATARSHPAHSTDADSAYAHTSRFEARVSVEISQAVARVVHIYVMLYRQLRQLLNQQKSGEVIHLE